MAAAVPPEPATPTSDGKTGDGKTRYSTATLTAAAGAAVTDVAKTARAAVEQTTADAKAWFNAFTKRNATTINGLGTVLSKAGGCVPLVGPAVTAVGDICCYFAEKAEADMALVASVEAALEELQMKLEVIGGALEKIPEDQKSSSKVDAEIKVLFAALIFWGKECKSEKMPQDFLGSIKRKAGRLDAVIQAESLQKIHEIKDGVDKLQVTAKDVHDALLRPLHEVYEEGKDFYKNKQWVESKQKFQEVARRKLAGEKLEGRSDNSKWYFDKIEEHLNEGAPETASGIVAIKKDA